MTEGAGIASLAGALAEELARDVGGVWSAISRVAGLRPVKGPGRRCNALGGLRGPSNLVDAIGLVIEFP